MLESTAGHVVGRTAEEEPSEPLDTSLGASATDFGCCYNDLGGALGIGEIWSGNIWQNRSVPNYAMAL